jgi:PleD family two-component response regulator
MNKRLLIIEDDYDVAEMLMLYFNGHHYDMLHAETGHQGIDLARVKFPHLILLDVMLPDMDGYAIFHTLRETAFTRYIPIIFLTQRDEALYKIHGLEMGADDYITKPFDIEELRLRVQGSIQRATRQSLHDPRTGLPTGRMIDEEAARRRYERSSYLSIGFALEGYDTFRDVYGFIAANQVFEYAARVIHDGVATRGTPDDFIGIDGERFILFTHTRDPRPLLNDIQASFEQGVRAFYSFQDAERGGIVVRIREHERIVPLLSLSGYRL